MHENLVTTKDRETLLIAGARVWETWGGALPTFDILPILSAKVLVDCARNHRPLPAMEDWAPYIHPFQRGPLPIPCPLPPPPCPCPSQPSSSTSSSSSSSSSSSCSSTVGDVALELDASKQPDAPNLNENISNLFLELASFFEVFRGGEMPMQSKLRIYKNAAKHFSHLGERITTKNYDRIRRDCKVFGVGDETWDKVLEIVETGTCAVVDELRNSKEHRAMAKFVLIYGVGGKAAADLVKRGCFSIEDLRLRQDELLNARQRLGLLHFDDINQRIPRAEVARIGQRVREAIASMGASMSGVTLEICGSYRRGAESSGDVDCLIGVPPPRDYGGGLPSGAGSKRKAGGDDPFGDTEATDKWAMTCKNLRTSLVELLLKEGVVTDSLSGYGYSFNNGGPTEKGTSLYLDQNGESLGRSCLGRDSFSGLAVDLSLPEPRTRRRIDIKIYATPQIPFALLYFTGCDSFNRSMRLHAQNRGLLLHDMGLHRTIKRHAVTDAQILQWPSIECHTERCIFKALGLLYKEPEERHMWTGERSSGSSS